MTSGFDIHLQNFEGPLDLLLHLIQKNEMDIYDIPMADITTQYLAILDTMQTLNLDIAGEFLLMAATLVHIKSRMLLPLHEEDEVEEEEADPRAELVRRLLEYQKYKAAAATLDHRDLLDRDVFARKFPAPELAEPEAAELEAISLFDLVEALRDLVQRLPEARAHEVESERLSVADRINAVLSLLARRDSLGFLELFSAGADRHEVVVTFLALLELVRLRTVRLLQNSRFGTIWLFPAVSADLPPLTGLPEEPALGYH
jgi:segregation and condensation protein A